MMPSQAEYMRRYRAARPEYRERDLALKRAYTRALRRTADRHQETFQRFYAAECEAEGVDVPAPRRPLEEAAS